MQNALPMQHRGYSSSVAPEFLVRNDPSAFVSVWKRCNMVAAYRRSDVSKNLTCILEHVVYGLCGLACLMHHRLISKMLYTFQTLLGRVK